MVMGRFFHNHRNMRGNINRWGGGQILISLSIHVQRDFTKRFR